jgi:hypothetical protein
VVCPPFLVSNNNNSSSMASRRRVRQDMDERLPSRRRFRLLHLEIPAARPLRVIQSREPLGLERYQVLPSPMVY